MVTLTNNPDCHTIIAQPNHSSSWRANLWLVVALAVPSLIAATGFALRGAWPILPFAGAELLALGAALYYINWKLQYRHVITLDAENVRIQKGYYAPRDCWSFARANTALAVTPAQHPWEGPQLSIHDRSEHVTVGEFLNREDALQLLEQLRRLLPVRTHSPLQQRDI